MFSSIDSESPLQLYQLVDDAVSCYRAKPAKELEQYVYYYWWLDVPPGDTKLEVIPDNAIDLVMSPDITDLSILYLTASEKFTIPLTGPITYVGISFRAAGASEFFSVSNDVMKSCLPGADTTQNLAVDALVNGVQGIESPQQLASVLDPLVASRLADKPNVPTTVEKLNIDRALAAMQASVGMRGMEAIANEFGLSDRQFRRVMGSLFGYGPKKIQRVMRLQASLKEILVAGALKKEDGFYDDAHKIKEIRALTGLTPGQIKRMSETYNSMY